MANPYIQPYGMKKQNLSSVNISLCFYNYSIINYNKSVSKKKRGTEERKLIYIYCKLGRFECNIQNPSNFLIGNISGSLVIGDCPFLTSAGI